LPSHPNILSPIGVSLDGGGECVVTPFASGGTLDQRLESLSWFHRLRAVAGAFRGIKALHKAGRVHGSVKSSNIFLSDDGLDARIGDAATAPPDAKDADPATLNYYAPEYLESGVPSEASDVYGMGVVLLEILTSHKGQVPPVDQDSGVSSPGKDSKSRATTAALLAAAAAAGWPEEAARELAGVAASCVRTNVERRKTALVVSKALEQLAADEAADAGGVDELVKKLGASSRPQTAAMERLADFSKMNPKERARQEVAALKIQAIQRGNVARAKVKRLMDEGADDDEIRAAEEEERLAQRFENATPEEIAAAVKVQAAFRGKRARKRVMQKLQEDMASAMDLDGDGVVSDSERAFAEEEVALRDVFGRIASMLADSNHDVQRVAAAALDLYTDAEVRDPEHARRAADVAVGAGVLGPLVSVLSSKNQKAVVDAAVSLENITIELPAEQNRALRAGALESALRLMSHSGKDAAALRAAGARAFRGLLMQNPPACRRAIEKGGLDVLMHMLEKDEDESQAAASSALAALADADSEILQKLGVERLVTMAIRASTPAMRTAMIAFVSKLARDSDTHEQIIEAGGIELLLGMILRLNEEAVWGIASMSSVEDNWASIDEVVDDETVESLKDLLEYGGDYGKEGAAWAVCYMAGCTELQIKLVRGNLLAPLIDMVKNGTRRCKKAAERALKAMAM
jgi:hypothetical protein